MVIPSMAAAMIHRFRRMTSTPPTAGTNQEKYQATFTGLASSTESMVTARTRGEIKPRISSRAMSRKLRRMGRRNPLV